MRDYFKEVGLETGLTRSDSWVKHRQWVPVSCIWNCEIEGFRSGSFHSCSFSVSSNN